jgi:hypothetical protein
MKIEQAKFLQRVTEDQGNQECDIRESYSGRGMYGRETVGIVVDSLPQLLTDVLNYVNSNIQDDPFMVEWGGDEVPHFNQFSTDNMGRSMILY